MKPFVIALIAAFVMIGLMFVFQSYIQAEALRLASTGTELSAGFRFSYFLAILWQRFWPFFAPMIVLFACACAMIFHVFSEIANRKTADSKQKTRP